MLYRNSFYSQQQQLQIRKLKSAHKITQTRDFLILIDFNILAKEEI